MLLLVTAVLAAPAAASAAQRYAAPNGTGTMCSQAQPCPVKTAIEVSSAGDEVIVQPGDHAVSSTISAPNQPLDIHGVDGQPRPRLVGAIDDNAILFAFSSPSSMTVRHLAIEQMGSGGEALSVFGGFTPNALSDLVLTATGSDGVAFRGGAGFILRDSVARTTGSGGQAVLTSSSATAELRNVTAHSSGPGSIGVSTQASCTNFMGIFSRISSTLPAKNLIARGAQYDLAARGVAAGSCGGTPAVATINVSHSNYRPGSVQQSPPEGVIGDQGNNQSGVPLFANLAAGDFHQLAGSPTIDAGTADPMNGSSDFDGDPRTLGARPDIGADEFVPPAPVGGAGGGPGGTLVDAARPILRLALRRQKLRVALRRGYAGHFTTNEPGTGRVVLLAEGRDARGLKASQARRVRVARGSKALGAAGRARVVAKFTKRAKRRFRSRRKLRLLVRVTVADRAGNRTTKSKRVTLRR